MSYIQRLDKDMCEYTNLNPDLVSDGPKQTKSSSQVFSFEQSVWK